MDFEMTEEQRMICKTAREIAEEYDPDYWLEKANDHEFGQEFWDTIVDTGLHLMPIPEENGGAGMGLTETVLAISELCGGGCGFAGFLYLCLNSVFGSIPILKMGDEYHKENYLERLLDGEICCLGLTEPEGGSNPLNTQTSAEKDGDEYVINGEKIYITGSDIADMMTLLTRTTPIDEVPKKSLGLSVFLVDLPDPAVEVKPIDKHGLDDTNSCEVYIDDLRVPKENLLGEKDKGWYKFAANTLNPERITSSACAVGMATASLDRAVDYANEREVFGAPIGSHQGIQFPLAESYAEVEAARVLTQKASWAYDQGEATVKDTSIAKHVAIDSGHNAIYHAMQTFGGYGYTKEYHIERWWREINLLRLGPISKEMNLATIGRHVLGLPKSY